MTKTTPFGAAFFFIFFSPIVCAFFFPFCLFHKRRRHALNLLFLHKQADRITPKNSVDRGTYGYDLNSRVTPSLLPTTGTGPLLSTSSPVMELTSPTNRREENELFRYAGVGVYFAVENGNFVVTSVTEGGSADRSGQILPRDTLKTAGGRPVEGWSLESVKRAIMGDYGTFVSLGFSREEATGSTSYYEVRLVRGTPPYLKLWDEQQILRHQLQEVRDLLLSARQSLAAAEGENSQLSLETERLRSMLQMTEEQLQRLNAQLNEETRNAREAHSRVEALETTARLDAEELSRLRRTVADYEGELKLAKAVAEEYKEKSEQESALRKLETQRKQQAEIREQQSQKELNAEHEARYALEVRLESSERSCVELRDHLRRLEADLAAERDQRETALNRARAAEEDRAKALARIDQLQTQIITVENQRRVDIDLISQLQQETANQSSRLATTSAEYGAEQRNHRQTQDQLRQQQQHAQSDAEEISRLGSKLEAANTEVSQLRSALDNAQREITDSETRCSQMQMRVNSLVADLRRVEQSVAAAQQDTATVRDQLAKAESALQAEKTQVYTANDKIRSLEDARRQLHEDLTTSRQQAETSAAEVERLRREVAELVHTRQTLTNTTSQLEQQIDRFIDEVGTLKRSLDATTAEAEKQRRDAAEQSAARQSLAHANDQLQQQVEHNNNEIARLTSIAESVSGELALAKAEAVAAAKRIAELEAAVEQYKLNANEMQRELSVVRNETVQLQSRLRETEHREQSQEARARDLESTVAVLRNEIASLKSSLDESHRQISQLQIDTEAANRRTFAANEAKNAAEREVAHVNEQFRNVTSELNSVRAALARETDAVAEEKKNHARTHADLDGAKKQVENEQRIVHELNIELDKLRQQVRELQANIKGKEGEVARASAAEAQARQQAVAKEEQMRKSLEEERIKLSAANGKVDELVIRIHDLEAQLKVNDLSRQKLESLYARLRQMEEETAKANDAAKEAKEELAAFYRLPEPCGVGMQVESDGSNVEIRSLLPDMAASNSGALQAGDFLLAIDGRSVIGMPTAEVRQLIVGRRGSYVTLNVRRNQSTFEVKLKRGSYGPEFHIVNPEPYDGSNPNSVSVAPEIPAQRNSATFRR